MSEDVKQAVKKDYLNGMKQKEICDKHKMSNNTLKSWIKRYKWADEKRNKDAPKKKKGAPLKNKNAKGHGAPKGNKNAEKFGLYSKYLPDETLELVDFILEKSQLDILWEQISLQYAAILRAQRLMHVKTQDDHAKEIKKDSADVVEYEFQFAWDRQATFLNAQSRAMSELRNLIKQYDQMVHANYEMATEEQKLRIEHLKHNVAMIKSSSEDDDLTIVVDYGD